MTDPHQGGERRCVVCDQAADWHGLEQLGWAYLCRDCVPVVVARLAEESTALPAGF